MNYGTTDGILKPLSEVILPDPRFQGLVFVSDSRPFELADMHQRLSTTILHPTLPADVRLQFETARNLMLYAWFIFEFQTIAEMQAYAALELALRLRFPKAKHGLRPLLQNAAKEGLIIPGQLRAWQRMQVRRRANEEKAEASFDKPLSESEWLNMLLDVIPNFRNSLAHGNFHLYLTGSFDQLELCADLINALFASPTSIPTHGQI